MEVLATSVLLLHLAWIGLLVCGALWTRGRPFWTAVHVLSLLWGILVEVVPWPCPLTLAEQYFEGRAGIEPYQGSCLLHYADALVYPHLSYWTVAACGVAVCSVNLGIYLWRFVLWVHKRQALASNPIDR